MRDHLLGTGRPPFEPDHFVDVSRRYPLGAPRRVKVQLVEQILGQYTTPRPVEREIDPEKMTPGDWQGLFGSVPV